MGVDVEMKVRLSVPVSDEAFADVSRRFRDAFPAIMEGSDRGGAWRYPELVRRGDEVALSTVHRYYGEGYERGDWPDIRRMGDWLAVAFGELGELRYGGDVDPEYESLEPWASARATIESHWRRVGHLPYRGTFGAGCSCAHCATIAA